MMIRDRVKEMRRVKACDLIDNPKNWRRHPDEQRKALQHIVDEIGIADALLVRETPNGLMLIDGHLRKSEFGSKEVPVLILDVTEEEADKLLVTLDPLAEMATTSHKELEELLNSISFDSDQLRQLAESMGNGRDQDVSAKSLGKIEEIAKKWGVTPGSIWEVGGHRILCGDSTSAEDVSRLLENNHPILCVTDPPYGVNYDPTWRSGTGSMGMVANDDRSEWQEAFKLFGGNVCYIWHASLFASVVMRSLEVSGFEIRSQIIWSKPAVMSHGHYHWAHEPCWYAVRQGKQSDWIGDRKQSTVWEVASVRCAKETEHSTEKPVECMLRPIRNHSGDVYEPFAGSGTTLVAAEIAQRRCFAMEILPENVAVILERMTLRGLPVKRVG